MFIDTNGFEIGDVVRDKITAFEGVITGITQWTTGCARATVQPRMTDKAKAEGGKMPESWGIDVLNLEMIEPGPRHAAQPDPETIGAGKGGPPTRSIRDH